MSAGGTRFKSSSRGPPPRSPDSTPVCAISMSSSIFIGSPRSPSGIPVVARPGQSSPQLSTVRIRRNQSWPLPRRRHARHRLDEGVRQSRPGHPGVGRFGSCFPRRSPDPEDRASDAAFPRRPDGDTVGGPSAAPRRISRILSGTDVESIPPFLGFCGYSGCSRPQGTVLGGGFPTLSYRTARGVSIPARGVHGFLLRPLRTGRDLRFSEVRVAAA